MELARSADSPVDLAGAADFLVCATGRRGYVHAACYQELVEALFHGLRLLGYRVALSEDAAAVSGNGIIVGAHLLDAAVMETLPAGTVIYNTEHAGAAWFTEAYRALLRRLPVWDYSAANAARLRESFGIAARFVPLGYVPQFTRVRGGAEDIDVLFYGSPSPRRDALLAEMREAGMRVHQAFGVYGAERDALIARARLILNVHYYLPGAFEIIRVLYALANRRAVVTECNAGESVDADLRDGLAAAPYEQLVAVCRDLLARPGARAVLAEAGFAAATRRPEAAILRDALAATKERFMHGLLDARTRTVPTIGLCMIVKNEAHVIERCLDSMKALIDYALVEDTGSTDGTQDVVRRWLARHGIAGEVREAPWRDFATNRSAALASLRERAEVDYAFVMDADDVLVREPGFDPTAFKAGLREDLYHVQIRLAPLAYFRPQLCRNRLDFRYRGVLHEFLEGPDGHSRGTAAGIHIRSGRDGARSRDPQKYRNDAEMLERALAGEADPFLISRYTFYLAQSWRDAGESEKALARYLERAQLGFWHEEVFISLYAAAQLAEQLGHADVAIIGTYLKGYEVCPTRAESLHGAMRYCRINRKFHQGFLIGQQAVKIARPASGLFLRDWIYEYGVLDEFSILAYWAGHYAAAREASDRLLAERTIPENQRARIEKNAEFARARA